MTTQWKHNAGDLPFVHCVVLWSSSHFVISLLTHPQHTPARTKGTVGGLRMKMRPNQDVRGDAKKCASSYAIGVRQSLSRA